MTNYNATGLILDTATSDPNPSGLTVEAWDARGLVTSLVGHAITDADGRFRMEFTSDYFVGVFGREDVELYFRVLVPVAGARWAALASTENKETWRSADRAKPTRIFVDTSNGTSATPGTFTVRGQVKSLAAGVFSGEVEAWDVGIGAETELPSGGGTGTIDGRGFFRIDYPPADLLENKLRADIELRVFDAVPTQVATMRVYRAMPTVIVNIVIDGDVYRTTQYEAVQSHVTGFLAGANVGALDAAQVDQVRQAARRSRDEVNALARAAALNASAGIDAKTTFGLLRQGLSVDRDSLLSTRKQTLQAALDRAVASRHIDEGSLGAFRDAAREMALDPLGPNDTANLEDVIRITLDDDKKRDEFLEAYFDATDIAAFWNLSFSEFTDSERDDTKLILQLAALTARHLPLLDSLWSSKGASWDTLEELGRHDEASWKSNWVTALGTNLPFDNTSGAKLTADQYAALLVRHFETALPTKAIAGRFAAQSTPPLEVANAVTFLTNNPSFDFRAHRVGAYFNGAGDLSDITDEQGTKRFLQSVERLFRVTKRHEEIDVLLNDGVRSARGVARMGRKQFITKYQTSLTNAANAAAIYDRAVAQSAAATQLIALFHPRVAGPTAAFLPSFDGTVLPASPDAVIADWSSLFGSPDVCGCEHCQSVLSPTAYLVELLTWLHRFDAETSGTARDVLFTRRPDIGDTLLSCANTNTPVPYIDLVNEILERAVAGSSHAIPLETRATSEELLASPEYIEAAAYDESHLGGAIYPFNLPYSLWHHQARVFLDHLGTPRAELLEALQRPFRPTQIASCKLWLRADLGLAVHDGRVSEWRDLSGYDHRATQTTVSARPRPSSRSIAPAIEFDGASTLTIAHHAALEPTATLTVVIVASGVTTGAVARMLTKGDAAGTHYGVGRAANDDGVAAYSGGTQAGPSWSAASEDAPSYAVITLASDATTWRIKAAGAAEPGQSNTLTTNAAALVLGAQPDGSEALIGRLHEVMLFDDYLPAQDLARLEGYLAERYQAAPDIVEPSAVAVAQERLALTPLQQNLLDLTPLRIEGCGLWLRSDLGVTHDGGAVSSWANQGSLGGTFDQATGSSKPAFSAHDLNWDERPTLSFDGGDVLVSSLGASAWKFLHEGAGCTVVSVVRWTSNSGDPRVLSTMGSSATSIGFRHYVKASLGGMAFAAANGTAAQLDIATPSADATRTISIVRHGVAASPPIEGRLDTSTFGAGNYAADATNGDPTETLHVGGFSAGAHLTGTIAEVIAFDRVLADDEIQELEGYLQRRYVTAPAAFWGLSDPTWHTDLLNAATLTARAELSYDALRELVDTRFVDQFAGAGQSVRLLPVAGGDPCSVASQRVVGLDTERRTATWDALHRFLRLVRVTGWPIREADALVQALGAGALHVETVTRLADAVALMKMFPRLPRLELATWWGAMETTPSLDRPSLYAARFLTTSLGGAPPANFALDTSGEPMGGTVSSERAHILAALRMSTTDFALLTDAAVARDLLRLGPTISSATAALSIAVLSRLFRVASFARTVGMTVAEVRVLQALSGLAPLEGDESPHASAPSEARELLAIRDKLASVGLTISQAHWLVRNLGTTAAQTAQQDNRVDQAARTVAAQLANVVIATTPAAAPEPKDLRDLLTQLLTSADPARDADDTRADVDAVMAIVEGTSLQSDDEQATTLHRVLGPLGVALDDLRTELLFRPYELDSCELWLQPNGIQDDDGRVTAWANLAPTSHTVALPLPNELPGCVLWLRADRGVTAAAQTLTLTAPSAFDDAAWTKTNVTAPSTDTATEAAGTDVVHHVEQSLAAVGAAWDVLTTFRVRAKRPATDPVAFIWIDAGDSDRVFFNLIDGAVGTEEADAVGTITAEAGGWFLCEATFVYRGTAGVRIGLAREDGTILYTVGGADLQSVELADAEIEQQALRVSLWADQSGVGPDAFQATAAAQPTFDPFSPLGRPAVFFDSRDVWLDLGSSAIETDTYTVFSVAALDSGTNRAIWSNRQLGTLSGGTKTFYGAHSDGPDLALWVFQSQVAPANGASGGTWPYGVPATRIFASDGVSRTLYLDQATVSTEVPQSNLKTRLAAGRVASDENGVTSGWHGPIAELAHFEQDLDQLQLAQLTSYADWRYTTGHAEPRVTGDGPFGLRAVLLDGVSGWLPANVAYASPDHTFVAMVRQNSLGDPTTGMALLDAETGSLVCAATAKAGSEPAVGFKDGASWIAHHPAENGDHTLAWRFDDAANECTVFRDGQPLGATAAYTGSIQLGGLVGIGGRLGGEAAPFDGAIACVGLFSTALSDLDLTRTQAYLDTLAGKVPASRYLVVLEPLLAIMRLRDSRTAIQDSLATAFDVTPAVARELTDHALRAITSPDQPLIDELLPESGTWHTRRAAVARFAKAATIIAELDLDDDLVTWLAGPHRDQGWLDLNDLPTGVHGEEAFDATVTPVTSGRMDLPPWLTIACATSARTVQTGPSTVTEAAADTPRAQSRDGRAWTLLVEPPTTNFVDDQDFSTWTTGSPPASVQGLWLDPRGNSTAFSFTDGDMSGVATLSQTYAHAGSGTSQTLSLWARVPSEPVDGALVSFADAPPNGPQIELPNLQLDWTYAASTAVVTSTPAQLAVFPRDNTANDTGSIELWGVQLEQRNYPTSFIGADGTTFTRAADTLAIDRAQASALAAGWFDITLRYAPLYAHDEAASDHDLVFIDADHGLRFNASSQSFDLRLGGSTVASTGALSFARHAVLTLRIAHTPDGVTLSVKGTTGDGTFTAAPAAELSVWPALVYVLGNASGAQEGAELHALRLSAPTAPHDLEDARKRFAGLLRLIDAAALESQLARRGVVLADVFASTTGAGALDEEAFLTELCHDAGWARNDVDTLVKSDTGLGLAYPSDYRSEAGLLRLANALTLSERLGVSVGELQSWLDVTSGTSVQQATAAAVVRAAKAQYEPQQWADVAKPLRDQLRSAQRAALVAHLVHTDSQLHTADDLFEKILVDAEMTPCMMTSRIKLALSSIQTFIQRRMLGLDDDVVFDKDARDEWEWRKSYRVWEANRKVFLWPENWIEPELRDDKTPLFANLENKLRQTDIDEQSIEAAYREYLQGLDEIADLKPVGMVHEQEAATATRPSVDRLHVFAQTRGGSPRALFYRQWLKQSEWTPWARMPIDAAATTYLPIVEHGRLSLWWPTITRQDTSENQVRPTVILNVSHFDATGWSGPVSTEQLQLGVNATARLAHERDTEDSSHSRVLVVDDEDPTASEDVQAPVYEHTITLGYDPYQDLHLDPVEFRTVARATTSVDPCTSLPGVVRGSHVITDLHTYRPKNAWMVQGSYRSVLGKLTMPIGPDECELFTNLGIFEVHIPNVRWLVDGTEDTSARPINTMFVRTGSRTMFGAFDPFVLPFENPNIALGTNWSDPKQVNAYHLAPIDITMTPSAPGSHTYQLGHAVKAPYKQVRHGVRFWSFSHPYVCQVREALYHHGLDGLRDYFRLADPTPLQELEHDYFTPLGPSNRVTHPHPKDEFDFRFGGPYATYNWELFFHVPLMLAKTLTRAGRYEDAQAWLHAIFNPTDIDPTRNDLGTLDAWRFRPFRELDHVANLLEDVNHPTPSGALAQWLRKILGAAPEIASIDTSVEAQIEALADDPFNPHRLARMRPIAYEKAVFAAYIENLTAWGDQLFRRDSIESINEAFQLYLFASQLLGPRPVEIEAAPPPVFANLMAASGAVLLLDLDREVFSDTLGTTDASDGDPVALIKSQLGGHEALQASSTPQPRFETDGWGGGRRQAVFVPSDGDALHIDDHPSFDVGDHSFLVLVSVRFNSLSGASDVLGQGDPGTDTNGFRCFVNGSTLTLSHGAGDYSSFGSLTTDTDYVLGWGVDADQGEILYVINDVIDRSTQSLHEVVASGRDMLVGAGYAASPTTARHLDGAIRAVFMVKRATTPIDSGEIADWVQALQFHAGLSDERPRTAKTFNEIEADLDAFGNVMIEVESATPVAALPELPPPTGVLPTLELGYFCLPQNHAMLRLWDTVEDRLFKIRNCMNIEGVVRQLALFQPPIDPALLVRARAAGLDLGSVLNNLYAPPPLHRYGALYQRAADLVGFVSGLGQSLLSALEKKDAEELSTLRATQEIALLELVSQTRRHQIEEAERARDATAESLVSAAARQRHYADLIEQGVLNADEARALLTASEATDKQATAGDLQLAAQMLHAFPDVSAGLAAAVTYGPPYVARALEAVGSYMSGEAAQLQADATYQSTMAGYGRRLEDWQLQKELADAELIQIGKQVAAAEVRVAIAESELRNHERQLADSRVISDFLKSKFTNQDLYLWMQGELQTIYRQAYQLAFEMARRAERAYQFERGEPNTSFIQFGHWDGLHKGLLAGEKLMLDLRRMDMAYVQNDRREFELTKSISLLQLNPAALIALRETGRTTIDLPETLFDADYPGHHFRRIKSVSVTIPGVTGPHTNINATLTLLSSKIRREPTAGAGYAESPALGDSRFLYNFTPTQSICTSSGLNDAGVFELSFRDERLVPFEGGGAVSRWSLELPQETNRFELRTITDVVMHMQLTARAGGGLLRQAALEAVRSSESSRALRLVSVAQELAKAWARMQTELDENGSQVLIVDVTGKLPFIPGTGPVRLRRLSASLDIRHAAAATVAIDAQIQLGGPPAFNLVLRDAAVPSGSIDLEAAPIELTGTTFQLTIGQGILAALPADLTMPSPDGEHTVLNPDTVQDLLLILDLERDPLAGS